MQEKLNTAREESDLEGGISFDKQFVIPTMLKKDIKASVQALIDRHPLNVEWPAQSVQAMNDLLGSEYLGFVRRKNPTYHSDPRHLHALSADGWSDVSWNQWISPKPQTQLVKKALRLAVEADVSEARATLMESECQNCGATTNLTVDHKTLPFDMLAALFLGQLGYMPELVDRPGGVGERLANIDDEAAWIAFHARHSTYQILCRSCNASKGKRIQQPGAAA